MMANPNREAQSATQPHGAAMFVGESSHLTMAVSGDGGCGGARQGSLPRSPRKSHRTGPTSFFQNPWRSARSPLIPVQLTLDADAGGSLPCGDVDLMRGR